MEESHFLDQQRRRLIFLSRKFFEELATNEKIFVCFQNGEVDNAEVFRLHCALRRYGDVTLLQVRLHDEAHQPGTVEEVAQGTHDWLDRALRQPATQ